VRRTYEWKIEDGETVWCQEIIPTRKKTPIFKVSAVEIDSHNGYLQLMLRGEGIGYHTPFHDGIVWVWQERPL